MRLTRPERPNAPTPEDRALAKRHGERATSAATAADGVRLVATDVALHVGDERLPWDRVAKATWDDETSTLTVVASATAERPATRRVIALTGAERLLETVRVAVTSSVLVSTRIESDEHGGAWITARRSPAVDEVRWVVVFDPGLDPAEPGRRAWADAAVAELRGSLGV